MTSKLIAMGSCVLLLTGIHRPILINAMKAQILSTVCCDLRHMPVCITIDLTNANNLYNNNIVQLVALIAAYTKMQKDGSTSDEDKYICQLENAVNFNQFKAFFSEHINALAKCDWYIVRSDLEPKIAFKNILCMPEMEHIKNNKNKYLCNIEFMFDFFKNNDGPIFQSELDSFYINYPFENKDRKKYLDTLNNQNSKVYADVFYIKATDTPFILALLSNEELFIKKVHLHCETIQNLLDIAIITASKIFPSNNMFSCKESQ